MLRLTHISAIWNAPQYLKNCHVAVRPDAGPTAIPSQQLSTAIQGSLQQIPVWALSQWLCSGFHTVPLLCCLKTEHFSWSSASKLDKLVLWKYRSYCWGVQTVHHLLIRMTAYVCQRPSFFFVLLFFKPFFACVHGSACANFSLLMSPSFLRTKLYSEHSFEV